jgi:D-alanine--poly(phosphoribitol) ligase subunit 1
MNELVTLVFEALQEHSARNAVSQGDSKFTFQDLGDEAKRVAATLAAAGGSGPVGIYSERSFHQIAAIIGCVLSGHTYVPLHPEFPRDRVLGAAKRAGCDRIIVAPGSEARFAAVADGVDSSVHWVLREPGETLKREAGVRFWGQSVGDWNPESNAGSPGAYILFTSGSTGEPKGIAISHHNLMAYLRHSVEAYGMRPGDRASQMFEFTFDLSVHDYFVTLLCGGCLCLPTRAEKFSPASYIKRNEITHWFSVPSVLSVMNRLGELKAGAFPSIRQSLFCGEALPWKLVSSWMEATPHSTVFNLYGPTEATIAITAHEVRQEDMPEERTGVVPIGRAFPGQQAKVLDGVQGESGRLVGELILAGSQLSPGYLGDEKQTNERFIAIDGGRWYRTGDLVYEDESGVLYYCGRVDHQVQIRGHRVELQEIEIAIVKAAELNVTVVVVPVYAQDGLVSSLIACLETAQEHDATVEKRIIEDCKRSLPQYMLPSQVIGVARMPLNSNGKIDRKKLAELIRNPT